MHYRLTGAGAPVTVFAHGLASGADLTRPYGSGVAGTKAYLHFRGHGPVPVPAGAAAGYPELAGELTAVADVTAATRALGVSLGAATLLAVLAAAPARFHRVVLVLPAVIDTPRSGPAGSRLAALAAAVRAGDTDGAAALLAADLPPELPGAASWARQRVASLSGTALAGLLDAVTSTAPVPDRRVLAAVTAPVLVVTQAGDPLHPAAVGRELAAALPHAALVELGPQAVWRDRAGLRAAIAGFLNEPE